MQSVPTCCERLAFNPAPAFVHTGPPSVGAGGLGMTIQLAAYAGLLHSSSCSLFVSWTYLAA